MGMKWFSGTIRLSFRNNHFHGLTLSRFHMMAVPSLQSAISTWFHGRFIEGYLLDKGASGVRRSWQSAVRSPQFAVRNLKLAVHSWQSTVGSPQSQVGSPQLAICSLQYVGFTRWDSTYWDNFGQGSCRGEAQLTVGSPQSAVCSRLSAHDFMGDSLRISFDKEVSILSRNTTGYLLDKGASGVRLH